METKNKFVHFFSHNCVQAKKERGSAKKNKLKSESAEHEDLSVNSRFSLPMSHNNESPVPEPNALGSPVLTALHWRPVLDVLSQLPCAGCPALSVLT